MANMNDKVMDTVYDITVVYPEDVIQRELDLLTHGPPRAIYFHIKRHPAKDLPESQADLEAWLNKTWTEKEETLKRFYEKKTFGVGVEGRRLNAIPLLYLSGAVWTALVIFWLWLLSTYLIADVYLMTAMVVYSILTFSLNGIDRFELARYKLETAA